VSLAQPKKRRQKLRGLVQAPVRLKGGTPASGWLDLSKLFQTNFELFVPTPHAPAKIKKERRSKNLSFLYLLFDELIFAQDFSTPS